MAVNMIPITKRGYEKLKEELKNLRLVERPKNRDEVETARAHGDLRENAEYHAAREKQSFINSRIQELDDKISRMQVVDPEKLDEDRVVFGATITITDCSTQESRTFQIVGEEESDLENNKIAYTAPLAAAFIGKEIDDEPIKVKSPGGVKLYILSDIEYK